MGARAWDLTGRQELPGAAGTLPRERLRAARPDRHRPACEADAGGTGTATALSVSGSCPSISGTHSVSADRSRRRSSSPARASVCARRVHRTHWCAHSEPPRCTSAGTTRPRPVADGKLDGTEASLGNNSSDEGENHLTVNLPLFPKTLTLFANDSAYDRLDDDQRGAPGPRRGSRNRCVCGGASPLRAGSDARLLRRGPARRTRSRRSAATSRRSRTLPPARLRPAREG